MAVFRLLHLSDFHFGRTADLHDVLSLQPRAIAGEVFSRLRSRLTAGRWEESDVHSYPLGAPCSYRKELLAFIRAFVHASRDKISGILLTGDLARTGIGDDLDAAENIGRNIAVLPTRGFSSPIVHAVMPGNHDRWVDQTGKPGATVFDSIFSPHWQSGLGGVEPASFPAVGAAPGSPRLHVLCADFCLRHERDALWPTSIGRLGQGHAYHSVVSKLEAETSAIRGKYPDDVVIWASHFPPEREDKGPFDGNGLILVRSDRLVEAASRLDVPLIVAGHLHGFDHYDTGNVQIIVAGSASCVSRSAMNSVHVLEITLVGSGPPTLKYDTFWFDERRSDFWRNKDIAVDGLLQIERQS